MVGAYPTLSLIGEQIAKTIYMFSFDLVKLVDTYGSKALRWMAFDCFCLFPSVPRDSATKIARFFSSFISHGFVCHIYRPVQVRGASVEAKMFQDRQMHLLTFHNKAQQQHLPIHHAELGKTVVVWSCKVWQHSTQHDPTYLSAHHSQLVRQELCLCDWQRVAGTYFWLPPKEACVISLPKDADFRLTLADETRSSSVFNVDVMLGAFLDLAGLDNVYQIDSVGADGEIETSIHIHGGCVVEDLEKIEKDIKRKSQL